jgi:zinc and cadmium transporter
MTATVPTLASVLAVSLVSIAGLATLSMREARVQSLAGLLVSFAAGTLLGDAFLHLLPEALARSGASARAPFAPLAPLVSVLAGILLFFVVEKLLLHRHGPVHAHAHPGEARPELALINVVGDAIHNFIDGALIAGSYLADPVLGLSTTLAVVFHEIPQELGDFGVLVRSGLSVRRALLVNLGSASMAILGSVAVLVTGAAAGTAVGEFLVPITAGGFIYIALADLIPDLQHDRTRRGLVVQSALMAAGIGIMAALTALD